MKKKIKGAISQKDAQQLSRNFTKFINSHSVIKTENPKFSNNAWFSIKDIELYLSYVKVQAFNSNEILSGIRIYLGNYDKKGEKGNFTVFISPTIESKANKLCPPEDDNDMNIDAFNFGKSGVPPYKEYPF